MLLKGVSCAELSFVKQGKGLAWKMWALGLENLTSLGPEGCRDHWPALRAAVTRQPGAVGLSANPDLLCLQQSLPSRTLAFHQDFGGMSGGLSEGNAQHGTEAGWVETGSVPSTPTLVEVLW